MNVITEWALTFLADLANKYVEIFTPILTAIADFTTSLLSWEPITRATTYVQVFATAALILVLLYRGVMMYGIGTEEELPLSTFTLRGVSAAAAVWVVPILVRQAIAIGTAMNSDLLGIDLTVTIDAAAVTNAQNYIVTGLLPAVGGAPTALIDQRLWGGLVMLVIITMMGVVVFQIAKRSIELALMCIAGPLFAVNYASPDRSMWNAWVRNVLLLTFTQVLQVFMLRLSLWFVFNQGFLEVAPASWPTAFRPIGLIILELAMLAVTIKAPKFFTSIMHQGQATGAGSATVNVLSTAVSGAVRGR
ncbi:MAG: hypothetical protein Q7J82_06650 [Coriobacteriia bacterium]|nr:hypothetical protein [Coriobacteriia bacterium]